MRRVCPELGPGDLHVGRRRRRPNPAAAMLCRLAHERSVDAKAALSPNDAILIDIRSHPNAQRAPVPHVEIGKRFQIALSVALKHDRDHPTD